MFRKAGFIFCFVALTLSAQWAYGQDASTPPAPSPSIPLADAKPVTPAQDKWEFDLIPYFWMAGLKEDLVPNHDNLLLTGVGEVVVLVDSMAEVSSGI